MDNAVLQDDPRYEIIDGKTILMSPSPAINHLRVIGNVYRIFASYLDGKRCEAFSDGADVHLAENNIVIPDVMIVCNKDIIKSDGIYGAPDLIVEVLSPSTAKQDKGYKKYLYEKYGVKEYWIVNPVDKSIEVYLLKDEKYELNDVYSIYPEWQWGKMTDDEKSKASLPLMVSLYDDLAIDIRSIFKNIP